MPAPRRPQPAQRCPTRTGHRHGRTRRPRRGSPPSPSLPADPIGTSSPRGLGGSPRVTAGGRVRLTTIRAPQARAAPPAVLPRRSKHHVAGRQCNGARTANMLSMARATCTAQSQRPCSPNSRVPSRGSTIQTRCASRRAPCRAPPRTGRRRPAWSLQAARGSAGWRRCRRARRGGRRRRRRRARRARGRRAAPGRRGPRSAPLPVRSSSRRECSG